MNAFVVNLRALALVLGAAGFRWCAAVPGATRGVTPPPGAIVLVLSGSAMVIAALRVRRRRLSRPA
ncbi:hypothetical protein [Amycolatopsis sp. CA-128772]|uniref:hypothetical protein n=1 Tax=Amycolatopsis sp. CA-128772 TaxID=2073159 RepID=UPI000CD2AFA8|nr:hypothetical protein [Amycolatopsis sp. CA-128772]